MSRRESAFDTSNECPLCGADIGGTVGLETDATGSPMGPKSPDVELVVCPDCDEVIDGFRSH